MNMWYSDCQTQWTRMNVSAQLIPSVYLEGFTQEATGQLGYLSPISPW